MASTTPNIGLTLPTGAENVSRQIINDNNTKIDTAIGTLNSNITNHDITLASISNDLNNAVTPGIVMFNGSQVSSVSNVPVSKGGYVLVFKCKDNEIIQEYITRRTEGIQNVFIRIKAGSTWSPWEEVTLNSKTAILLDTQTFANAKAMCNYFKGLAGTSFYLNRPLFMKVSISQPGDSNLFGTSSFMALAELSSANYGSILCMSDNKISGGIKNICIAVTNAYIESFTPTEVTISL